MALLNNTPFGVYCSAVCVVSIALNVLFLVVTTLRRVEGFQEVLVFMRNVSGAYILLSTCILLLAPQVVVVGSSMAFLPHGLLAPLDPVALHALGSIGGGVYLYTAFSFMVMFLYRYNVTCKTSLMSSVFSRRNIPTFLITAGVFCVIQSTLFYYSAVDSNYLSERLNRTKDIDAVLPPLVQSAQLQNLAIKQQSQTTEGQAGQAAQAAGTSDSAGGHLGVQQAAQLDGGPPARTIGIFGVDYTRNPMVFLAVGIFSLSNIVASVVILVASLVVACKLRGRQDSMSEQSQTEHQKLTNVLILDAYVPVLLAMIPALNFFVMIIRHDAWRFQEFLGVLILCPIPGLFPLMNVFLVPELRSTAFQVLTCMYWRNQRAAAVQEKKDNQSQGNEQLNQAQVNALKTMTDRAGMTAEQRTADRKEQAATAAAANGRTDEWAADHQHFATIDQLGLVPTPRDPRRTPQRPANYPYYSDR